MTGYSEPFKDLLHEALDYAITDRNEMIYCLSGDDRKMDDWEKEYVVECEQKIKDFQLMKERNPR